MSAENQPLKKSGLKGPLLVGGVATCAIAIAAGFWAFRTKPAASTPSSLETVAGSRHASEAPSAKGTATENFSPASDKDELLHDLRAKLAVSMEECLKSLYDLAKTQPALAIDLAQALGRTDDEKSEWVTNMMQQWANDNPQAAWQWLKQLPSRRMEELAGGDLSRVVLETMAAHDPNMLLASIDALVRTGNTSESVSTPVAVDLGLQSLIGNGHLDLARKAFDDWARDPLKPDLGEGAYATVATAIAQTAPQDAGTWLRSMPASQDRNDAMSSLAAVWAGHEPLAALNWAATLSPQEGQQAAINRTLSDSVEQHPTEVTQWLADYLSHAPADANTDSMIKTVINNSPLIRNDPSLALKWIDLITDPQQKQAAEERSILQWGRQDRTAAINYVQENSAIPAEQKQSLVQKLQNSQLSGQPEE